MFPPLVPSLGYRLLFGPGLPRAEACVFGAACQPTHQHTTARPHLKLLESTISKPSPSSKLNPLLVQLQEQSTQKMWNGDSINACMDHFQNNK